MDRRRFLLTSLAGCLAVPLTAEGQQAGKVFRTPELRLVREWLDSWSGLGLIVVGMTHQGWDAQLTAYAARDWRANFFPVGIAHSVVGSWERTS